ncbi:DUF1064 domain-containing protein [Peptoniphilus sp. AGMB00490]|uniref:DUF1064 domain-containing protein n=1 Tax=Peptoniphilus faecalis TaxID=2731255 RepID=A0A848RIT1_9FIRM|nr:DUF1064 domain-containing protein [Peptoniphilus faecalis]NMW84242.1 DUF1064 domain-containing protein [Peptoniphilus faecalis]
MTGSKYNSIKTKVDGIKFDSRKEAARYQELKLLERAGIIKELELQPRFLLQDKFKLDGVTHRKIEYVADFKYWDREKETWIVEDVKGIKTEVYKLKKKIFLKKYGREYTFIEI